MHLDLPTLIFVSFLAAISAAIGFTSLMLVLRGQAALRVWVASLWVSTAGIALISLRGQIPDFISIVLANGAIALAGALMVKGLAVHMQRRLRWRAPLAIVLAYAAGIAWFAYAQPDLHVRIVLASVQALIWNLWSIYLLLRHAPREIRLSCRILALILAADAVLFMIRPFVPLSPDAGQDLLRGGAPVTMTYVAGIVISLAAYFALLLLITERLMVDLRRAASIDALTGLLNRGAMLAEGRRALAASGLHGQPFAVLALDLDRFKQINDRWGHEGGDAVLVHAAAVLREVVAWPGHASGRYGGEEFLLTLPGADLRAASELAERLRAALDGSSVIVNGQRLRVTTSIGVAVGAGGASFEQLVSSADRALYRAKSDGRNCVRHAAADMLPWPSLLRGGGNGLVSPSHFRHPGVGRDPVAVSLGCCVDGWLSRRWRGFRPAAAGRVTSSLRAQSQVYINFSCGRKKAAVKPLCSVSVCSAWRTGEHPKVSLSYQEILVAGERDIPGLPGNSGASFDDLSILVDDGEHRFPPLPGLSREAFEADRGKDSLSQVAG